ncbi:MAG: TspO/MBR family protein [Cocleimonas sp.]
MTSMSKQTQILGFIGWLVVSFVTSAVGAIASITTREFYVELTQPSWAPPGWLFGPVWTILFAMMAIAAWLVWRNGGFSNNRVALTLFLGQLVLNGLWSWLFFAWHQGALALADITLLWILIAATIIAFWKVRPLAGMLLVPYLLWVSFAAVLSYTMWQLNPQILG